MRDKGSKINQVRVGAVLSYVNMAIGSLIPMFYTPIMLDLLGQSEYGLYKLSSSVTSYLSLISFGIGSAMVRYFTKYQTQKDKDGEENLFGLFNIIYWIIASVAVIAGIVITLNLGNIYGHSLTGDNQIQEMQILVIILSLNTGLSFLCSPYNSVVTSHERFLFLQIVNILITVGSPIINLLVLFLGFKSIGLVTSSLVVNIIVRIVYIIYVRGSINVRPRYNNLPKHLIKEILVFSFWVFLSNVVNQLQSATDTVIIGAVPALATIGVAVYNVGATFNGMMMNFSTGMLSVLTPKVNKMVFSNKSMTELTDLMIRVGRLQCYIVSLVCFGFISFGQPFIKLWAGEGYEEAYWVAIVTMIPACIPLVQSVAYNVIVAMNKHRFRSIVYLIVAIANVILTIPALNIFGVVGAALMTGICSIGGSLVTMNWYYWKKIKLEIPRFWKNVSKIYIGPIILCAITLFVSNFVAFNSWLSIFIGIIIFTSVFFVYNWLFIMTDYEKEIFIGPIKKICSVFSKKGN
ncbi:MAG: lipopolysaccharide biosynthesis protein [Ruminococcus sp.]